jgi:hypothetical protein
VFDNVGSMSNFRPKVFRWQNDVEGTSDVEGNSDLKYHALFHLHWPEPSELDVFENLECPSRSWS